VFITSDYFKGYGTIKEVKEDVLTLKIQEKTKQKTIEIPLQAISQARRAVKI
jgi:ribosome maturation factor RimP